jgi:hypothetical protein
VHALEAVRLIHALGLPHARTLRVVFFMNEENGARGADAYYKAHEGELARHVLAVESDAGGFTPRGFSTDAPPDGLALLREIAALLENAGAATVKPGHGGVDIGPLARAGVPLVGFRPDDERYFDHHHCERDTLDAVHPRELALGAGAIAGLLHVVANLPEPLPRNPPNERALARPIHEPLLQTRNRSTLLRCCGGFGPQRPAGRLREKPSSRLASPAFSRFRYEPHE